MDGFLQVSRPARNLGTLFADDFDMPEPVAPPVAQEPSYGATDLADARAAGWREGHAAGSEEAAGSDAAATRAAVEQIAAQLTAEAEAAATRAERSAEAIASLLIDSLAAAFPELCARHGDAEARAVIRIVLPALSQETAITVRAHPATAAAVSAEIERLDIELATRVQTVTCDTMSPGDLRIAWHNGFAVRDVAALWQQIAAVLTSAALLHADPQSSTETLDAG